MSESTITLDSRDEAVLLFGPRDAYLREIRTVLGVFTTHDRATWRTSSGAWTAELRQSRNGHHRFLALFEGGVYRGRYDASGWHAATDRKRVRQLRSYQLPLAA